MPKICMQSILKKTPLLLLLILFFFVNSLSAQETEVKVMTYNIWNGFDWGKDLDRKAKLVERVREKQPDVLALQELCGYTEELLKEDAKKWGHSYSVLLKTTGYPVGLTSNNPIVLNEKAIDGFWHGMLHCETYGIDFFVVHLSPADFAFRYKEAGMILERINRLEKGPSYLVLGDFNSHSPFDAEYLENNQVLKDKYRGQKSDKGYSNLHNQEFDYSVISRFMGIQAVDLCMYKVKPENRYSFPTPALIDYGGKVKSWDKFIKERERIDYILASPNLAIQCTEAQIYNGEENSKLSDHFPLMVVFKGL